MRSTLDAALHGNNIPVSVVETLVDVTRANTAGLQRYHRLRRRALGLDRYCTYDSQVPIVDVDRSYGYDEARAWVVVSVAPLGPAYQAEVSGAASRPAASTSTATTASAAARTRRRCTACTRTCC